MPSLSPAADPDFGAARAAARGGGRSLTLVVAAALLSAAALLWAVNDPLFAGAFLAGLCGLGAILLLRSRLSKARTLGGASPRLDVALRSEEHTSELQSLMRISYAVFCLKKKKQ